MGMSQTFPQQPGKPKFADLSQKGIFERNVLMATQWNKDYKEAKKHVALEVKVFQQ